MNHYRWLRRIAQGLFVALCATGIASASSAAFAAGPGNWSPLTQYPSSGFPHLNNLTAPTVLRTPNGNLQVVWSRQTNLAKSEYRTAVLRPSGSLAVADAGVIGRWSSLVSNPRLQLINGRRTLLFGSTDSTTPGGAPFDSDMGHYATSSDGLTWTVSPNVLTDNRSFYAGYGQDFVDDGTGQPFTITNGNGSGTWWDQWTFPPASPSPTVPFNAPGSSCCSYAAAVVHNLANDEIWGAYYSNASSTTARGVQYAQIIPTTGAFHQVAGTSMTSPYNGTTDNNGSRIALAARRGGGVFLATPIGYPSTTGIRLVRMDTGWSKVIPAAHVSQVSLTAAPGGRLWVTWIDRSGASAVVKAVRTNRAATMIGAVTVLGRPVHSSTIWHLDSEGSTAGRVDVVATSANRAGTINVFHSQALVTPKVTYRVRMFSGHTTVVLAVSDAGTTIREGSVRCGTTTLPIMRDGHVTFSLGVGVHGTYSFRVRVPGYASTTIRVTV